jgi:hypothetical protein
MHVSIFVRFRPTNLHNNSDELVVVVGDGVARVPITAQREPCQGQWPTLINCGHCWVGDQIDKQITIPNTGGEATYIMLNANPSEDEMTIGSFKIWPTSILIAKSPTNALHVRFTPLAQGAFEESVTFVSNLDDE